MPIPHIIVGMSLILIISRSSHEHALLRTGQLDGSTKVQSAFDLLPNQKPSHDDVNGACGPHCFKQKR